MFDFISYVRDMGVEIKIVPAASGDLITLELREPKSGYFERYTITNKEAASCGNIDTHTGRVLDRMAARVGAKRAKQYADRHISNQMRAREDFFRGK